MNKKKGRRKEGKRERKEVKNKKSWEDLIAYFP
jgi:hypothetical protein